MLGYFKKTGSDVVCEENLVVEAENMRNRLSYDNESLCESALTVGDEEERFNSINNVMSIFWTSNGRSDSFELGAAFLVSESNNNCTDGIHEPEIEDCLTQSSKKRPADVFSARAKQRLVILGRTVCERSTNDLEFALQFLCIPLLLGMFSISI